MQKGKGTQLYLSNENRARLAELPPRTASTLVNDLLNAFFETDKLERNKAIFRALLIEAEFEIMTEESKIETEANDALNEILDITADAISKAKPR